MCYWKHVHYRDTRIRAHMFVQPFIRLVVNPMINYFKNTVQMSKSWNRSHNTLSHFYYVFFLAKQENLFFQIPIDISHPYYIGTV